jgi:hypothetical protein
MAGVRHTDRQRAGKMSYVMIVMPACIWWGTGAPANVSVGLTQCGSHFFSPIPPRQHAKQYTNHRKSALRNIPVSTLLLENLRPTYTLSPGPYEPTRGCLSRIFLRQKVDCNGRATQICGNGQDGTRPSTIFTPSGLVRKHQCQRHVVSFPRTTRLKPPQQLGIL